MLHNVIAWLLRWFDIDYRPPAELHEPADCEPGCQMPDCSCCKR